MKKLGNKVTSLAYSSSSMDYDYQPHNIISMDVELNSGDQVYVSVLFYSTVSYTSLETASNAAHFSGRLVNKL